ncbi:MAG: hypothetical protein DI551_11625 [Micavibrio aeruginosavorus]|uniref:Uncharacterized protein n=1 Tax=Micavibrio aeruginosavorus TaxID=349221 RepID=A0A2W5MU41_9BACT|nr:MAG: hypothetical protein DI551_11625 [Micavibrio aeruginosavorus]
MKKIEKHILLAGFSLLAAGVCVLSPAPAMATGDTVSAVGAPSTPAPTTQPAPIDEFPPQPISVAPAEETPAVAPASPATTGTAVPTTPPQAGLTPVPQGASGAVSGTNVMGDSGVQQKHSGTYYDANAIVPDKDLAAAGAVGPRKIDPALEPGQKYVIVEKNAGATSYEAQYVAATRALKLGRYAAAMEMFEKLYKKNHKDPRILMGLAVAQQGAGFRESAANTYEDLLKIEPRNSDAVVNLMGIMKDQYPSVTLKKLMELRSKYPTNPGIPAQIGLINAEMKNYDDAIRYLEIASSMDPRNASHVYNMAIVTDHEGNASKAIKLYEQALQMDASYGDSASELPRAQIYDRLVVLRRKV